MGDFSLIDQIWRLIWSPELLLWLVAFFPLIGMCFLMYLNKRENGSVFAINDYHIKASSTGTKANMVAGRHSTRSLKDKKSNVETKNKLMKHATKRTGSMAGGGLVVPKISK